jgi:uncharacterized protein with ParB-like and HNH nuclease domain
VNQLSSGVTNKNFMQLFEHNIQFEVPFFQRRYAWEKRHWDQLFTDIEEQVISNVGSAPDLEDVEHFFGPMVVLEKANPTELGLKRFLIIDGQQRITTIYLMLAIIRSLLEERTHESQQAGVYINELNKYLENKVRSNDDDYIKLKVFSSKGDRLPTYHTVFNCTNPKSPHLHVDQQLYIPGKNNIDVFKAYAEKKLKKDYSSVPSLWQLAEVLLRSLKIVWISLVEGKDDPQAIYESLNDRGMQLTSSELLCNYIFKPLIETNRNYEDLHNEKWLQAQKKADSQGDFEDYLRSYLSIGENKMIGKGRRIYVHYKSKNKNLTASGAETFLEEVSAYADTYTQIMAPTLAKHQNSKICELLIKIKSTRMDAVNPFLLSLLKAHVLGSISDEDCEKAINEVYVLLVRRKMCELTTTKYDIIFPGLLKKIINEPNKPLAIQKIIKDEGYYISNQEFETALINKSLYRIRDTSFANMILQEIDKVMQSYGQLPDYTTLTTIEHIMPQTLDEYWKRYLGDEANHPDLAKYINTLGNLCLLSRPANSHAGQDPFLSKINDYTDVSALTRDIKTRKGVKWSMDEIINRSKDLSHHALRIWSWAT